MVMKSAKKSAFRLFKKHLTRLITVIAIVAVSVGFTSGIGELDGKIKSAIKKYYASEQVSDLYIKSSRPSGFSTDELSYLSNRFGEENIRTALCYETKLDGIITRLHFTDLTKNLINKLTLLDGKMPELPNEILAERATEQLKEYSVGDTLTLNGTEYTVCGIVQSPLMIHKLKEPSYAFEDEDLGAMLYIPASALPIVNDFYIKVSECRGLTVFGSRYEKKINEVKSSLDGGIDKSSATVLTLYENFGLCSLDAYADKVGVIGMLFVAFFLAVTLLVVYSTMSRLLDEERPQLACMKTLGYTDLETVGKYIFFVAVATVVGSVLAFPIGLALTSILYVAFALQYEMPPFPAADSYIYFSASALIIFAATVILTLITALKAVSASPSRLLAKKAPHSGKKVFIEHIKVIWNRLSFKHKSTLRNVFLFKSRFFMTVISIIGSTVLVFAGLGLKDTASTVENGESIFTVSVALTVFSAMLCALVVYNLTNINISERKREIATLMVLGYRDNEVTGYIFREVYVLAFIGAILGIPCGYLFLYFAFDFIDFGSVGDITLLSYIATPLITMLFAVLSTFMLRGKITSTDMNASLKSLE